MAYRAIGILKHLRAKLNRPPESSTERIRFDAEALRGWQPGDDAAEPEWKAVQGRIRPAENAIRLSAHFENVRRIDIIDRSEPRFWFAVSSPARQPLAIDVTRYAVLEVEARNVDLRGLFKVACFYPGGEFLFTLPLDSDWHTFAMLVGPGFPGQVDAVSLRCYGAWRETGTVEVRAVAFRALEDEEQRQLETVTTLCAPPQEVPPPVLPEGFFPFGVFMDAEASLRLGDIMDISFHDYWRLALEDIARHHCNCVVLENAEKMGPELGAQLVEQARGYDIRLIPSFASLPDPDAPEAGSRIEYLTGAFRNHPVIAAWAAGRLPEDDVCAWWQGNRRIFRELGVTQPLLCYSEHPGNVELLSRSTPVMWFHFFKSGVPWDAGKAVAVHERQKGTRALWFTVPAFTRASGAPEWCGCPGMRLMLNLALANGVDGWFTHAYHHVPSWLQGPLERSLTGPFQTFSDLWTELGNRLERLTSLAPVFQAVRPADTPLAGFSVEARKHAQSTLRTDISPVSVFWLAGEDIRLCHVVNNDLMQVTSVTLYFPEDLGPDAAVYDLTHFVRNRVWNPVRSPRRLEMFPGQGQVFLFATRDAAAHWRDQIAAQILAADQRQVLVDLDLARQYITNLEETEEALTGMSVNPLADLVRVHTAREKLINMIYGCPDLYETRSALIEASSLLCACDEALARLHASGRTEAAHDFGMRALPYARQLTGYRLLLRRGEGRTILKDCRQLIQSIYSLLTDIWARF